MIKINKFSNNDDDDGGAADIGDHDHDDTV